MQNINSKAKYRKTSTKYNLHIHFAINAVSYMDGKKWHQSRDEFKDMKQNILERNRYITLKYSDWCISYYKEEHPELQEDMLNAEKRQKLKEMYLNDYF